ncbi:substrate-binding periplasmic protein [Agarivorans albus]|uniref:Extracellular solute-binding protein n=1 Tax=Agarivorans albus MKT 106 TaxID=1331007 RepID=R9PKV9_AGAAL|nr:transporter substrate-binding domain-containing protein [Agarivorans albus]GAD01883.1 extracellular solute-binding protein [Agarivorans albus MKT 106]
MTLLRIFLCLLLSYPAWAQQTLTTANAHWPPWRTIESDGSLTGIEIELLKVLSARLDLQLHTKGCGWKRCLKHMLMGESDVMTGLYRNAEREQYMTFVEPAYRSFQSNCFYLKRDSQFDLNSYQDLYSLTIAVQSKVAYFKRFDQDQGLSKHEVIDDLSAFRLLKGQRVDAVVMSCVEGDYFLKEQGIASWFKHADYRQQTQRPVYLAISKLSPLVEREQEISNLLQAMLDSGEIDALIAGKQLAGSN